MKTRRKIHVLTTGGTIDKTYSEQEGSLKNRTSVIRQVITNDIRLPYTELVYFDVLAKDSADFTDEDRELLCHKIKELSQSGEAIVVVHGTDTMTLSAAYVQERLSETLSPIVFTGAMKPIGFVDSDGKQNVIEALYAAKIVDPGVYISFHGHLYEAGKVRKNPETKTFEEIKV
jgi:L-asparaginase